MKRECLLNTLLQTTTEVCKNSKLASSLAETMLDTVLFIWIKTKRNTEAMWNTLQRGVASCFHFMEPIEQTKLKVIQLTLVIRDKMYPVRKVKKKPVTRDVE